MKNICARFITASVKKLLHYRAGGLLQYRAVLLHYRAVITVSGVFLTLSGSYYSIGRLLHYRLVQVRTGEVCYSGESGLGSECFEDIRRHTVVTSQNGWLKAWNKYRGIALDGEDWCDMRHGLLIITPGGIGKKNSLIFVSSLIRLIPHVIHCHSNVFVSSAKSWITSFEFSLAIVH